jgi:hypothetical protein
LTTTRTATRTLIVDPSLTVPVTSPPGLFAAATSRNTIVTESPGASPADVPQVTDLVPPGQNTVPGAAAAFNRSIGAAANRLGPDGIAVTPGGNARVALTGPDTLPPLLRTVSGRSTESPPAISEIGTAGGVAVRFGGAGDVVVGGVVVAGGCEVGVGFGGWGVGGGAGGLAGGLAGGAVGGGGAACGISWFPPPAVNPSAMAAASAAADAATPRT